MTRVLLDTSVVIDPPVELPGVTMSFVSSVTLAELAAGVHTARNPNDFVGLDSLVKVIAP